MKFIVTAVAMVQATRRMSGKPFETVVEADDPLTAEKRHQREWELDHPFFDLKVIDVREAAADPHRDTIEGDATFARFMDALSPEWRGWPEAEQRTFAKHWDLLKGRI